MIKKLYCSILFVALLGCNRTGSQKQATPAVSKTAESEPQASSPVPAGEPATQPIGPSGTASPVSEVPTPSGTNGETATPREQSRPTEFVAGAPQADATGQRPSPFEGQRPYNQPKPAVTIPSGTEVRVRLADTLDSKHVRVGDRFSATLDAPILVRGHVVVPRRTVFEGHVTEVKSSGRLRGRSVLGLTLDSFRLHGTTYRVQTSHDVRTSRSHKKRNLVFIGGGSGFGAALGAIAGGGLGAVIGAGAGAAAGTTGALVTGKRTVKLPVETPLTFSLRRNVEVKT